MEAKNVNEECWHDITDNFKTCASKLNLGELLKTEQFTLADAMRAIELMDPKMDSGMVLKKIKREVLTLDQAIEAGTVKVSNLESDEMIGIMDDTYACLATWFDGHPISLTLMTNLYLHDTERIEDKCLKVFSQAILKIVDHLDRLVQLIFCIEEDDFYLNNGQFNLANHVNEQRILNSLEELCLHYERHPSNQPHNAINSSTNHNNHRQQNHLQYNDKKSSSTNKVSYSEDEIKGMSAIANRLRFTQSFYMFVQHVTKNILKEYTIEGQNPGIQLQKTLKLFHSHVNVCDQRLDKCLTYLNRWLETIEMGVKPPKADIHDDGSMFRSVIDYPTIMGFDPLINQKILHPTYPRCPPIKTRQVTLDYLRDLIIKLKECIILSNCFQKSFNRSLEALEYFSKNFEPKSCVISRSFILALYLPTRLVSTNMLRDELYQSLSDYCEPMMQLIRKDVTKSLAVNEFLEESARVFSQVIALYGHYLPRQHDRFSDLISAFKNLQYSAFLVNDLLKNNLVYSWTTYYFAKYCIKYVLFGLELELFSPHEYPYVFWYLYDILYRNEKEQLEYAKQLIYGSQYALDQEQASIQTGKQGSKLKGNYLKKTKKKLLVNTSFHDKNLMLNDALRFLSGGMFLLTYGLKLQGKIKSPSNEFTSEEICFDHRFGSITGSSVFQAYKFTLSRLEKISLIYREAFECFSEARSVLEKYGESQEQYLKVCKTNMVVARILETSSSNSSFDREVEFCFEIHPAFPTVKL